MQDSQQILVGQFKIKTVWMFVGIHNLLVSFDFSLLVMEKKDNISKLGQRPEWDHSEMDLHVGQTSVFVLARSPEFGPWLPA